MPLRPCLFKCGKHTYAEQRWCNECVSELETACNLAPPEPTMDEFDAHNELVATVDSSLLSAGILPVSTEGVWMCAMQEKSEMVWADYGGKKMHTDRTLWDTAVREAKEEGGWDFARSKLKSTSQIITLHNSRGAYHVLFLVPTTKSPRKTRDARVHDHMVMTSQRQLESLHPRLKYASGLRQQLRQLLLDGIP